jgi:hypothetical protein
MPTKSFANQNGKIILSLQLKNGFGDVKLVELA